MKILKALKDSKPFFVEFVILRLVGETVTNAFEKFEVSPENQYHICRACGEKYNWVTVGYIKDYVVFNGEPHACSSAYWGTMFVAIGDKVKF